MTQFNLYGWTATSLEAAAQQIQEAMTVEMELQESSYRGGEYYLWRGRDEEELIRQANFEDDDGYVQEPEQSGHEILLYTSGLPADAYDLLNQISGLDLLGAASRPESG